MPKMKYDKLIVTELKHPTSEPSWNPPMSSAGSGQGGRVLYLDSQILPGAFYMETVWIMPRPRLSPAQYEERKKVSPGPHSHDYDEIIAFIGSDPMNPHDLNAEVELWLGDEKHNITKTALVFIPVGLKHAPLVFLEVRKPVFHYTTGPGKMYY
jgi:hypothetical protein